MKNVNANNINLDNNNNNTLETVDELKMPLTFKAVGEVSVKLSGGPDENTYSYSMDGGETWEDYTKGKRVSLSHGETVSFKRRGGTKEQSLWEGATFTFGGDGEVEAWGNVMSMAYPENWWEETAVPRKYEFCWLFHNHRPDYEDVDHLLIKAPLLPATNLTEGCYRGMFSGCNELAEAPILPATKLAKGCYAHMFQGCTELAEAPVLPATKIAKDCYECMFDGCRNLASVTTASRAYVYYENRHGDWLNSVSSKGTFKCYRNKKWESAPRNASSIPEGWDIEYLDNQKGLTMNNVIDNNTPVDELKMPLTLKAMGEVYVTLELRSDVNTYSYSMDGGKTWEDYNMDEESQIYFESAYVRLKDGETISFKRRGGTEEQTYSDHTHFVFRGYGKVEASGNVMSMAYPEKWWEETSVPRKYEFYKLFERCESLTKAPLLPAKTLTDDCYGAMFARCRRLTSAPELPATELADSCYSSMFARCRRLTSAPELPATELADSCYYGMFAVCTRLAKAPELPATKLADFCYSSMFEGCVSLTEAPALPATTLVRDCYKEMFRECESLTDAPELPTMERAWSWGYLMFHWCRRLPNYSKLPDDLINIAECGDF